MTLVIILATGNFYPYNDLRGDDGAQSCGWSSVYCKQPHFLCFEAPKIDCLGG